MKQHFEFMEFSQSIFSLPIINAHGRLYNANSQNENKIRINLVQERDQQIKNLMLRVCLYNIEDLCAVGDMHIFMGPHISPVVPIEKRKNL